MSRLCRGRSDASSAHWHKRRGWRGSRDEGDVFSRVHDQPLGRHRSDTMLQHLHVSERAGAAAGCAIHKQRVAVSGDVQAVVDLSRTQRVGMRLHAVEGVEARGTDSPPRNGRKRAAAQAANELRMRRPPPGGARWGGAVRGRARRRRGSRPTPRASTGKRAGHARARQENGEKVPLPPRPPPPSSPSTLALHQVQMFNQSMLYA